MSVAALNPIGLGRDTVVGRSTAPSHGRTALFWGVAVVLLGVVFVNEHDLLVSRLPEYAHYDLEVLDVALGANLLRRVVNLGLGALGLGLIFFSTSRPLKGNWPLAIALAIFFCWCWASLLWTSAPDICQKRLIVMTCYTLAAIGIGRQFSVKELCCFAFLVTGAFLALGVGAELSLGTFQPWSAGHRFAGTMHPNSQGCNLSILCVTAYSLTRTDSPRRAWYWAALAAGFAFLLLTRSRTSAAATILALSTIWMLQTPLRRQLVITGSLFTAASAALWALMLVGFDPLAKIGNAALLGRTEEVESLTGRDLIWSISSEYIAERPWLGYGYESFWTAERIEDYYESMGFSVFQAHNGFLEILLWLGIVGLILQVAKFAVSFAVGAWRLATRQEPAYGLLVGAVVIGGVMSLSESGFMGMSLVPFLTLTAMAQIAFGPAETAAYSLARRASEDIVPTSPLLARRASEDAGDG